MIDIYSVRARLSPALVAAAPAAIGLGTLASTQHLALVQWIAGLCGVGFAGLTTAYVRDCGKAREPYLYAAWGGKPTSILLRHSDKTIDPILKTRYRLNLEKLVPGFRAPTQQEEAKDPRTADARYDTAIRWLIERTTDTGKFPKVFAHNCGYGFRRNLLGLRAFGYGSSTIATVIAFWLLNSTGLTTVSVLTLGAAVAGWVVFIFVVNSDFVKRAAFDYATHLIAATDALG